MVKNIVKIRFRSPYPCENITIKLLLCLGVFLLYDIPHHEEDVLQLSVSSLYSNATLNLT